MARYRRFDTTRAGVSTVDPTSMPDAIEGARTRRAGLRTAIGTLEFALAAPAPHRVDEWRRGVSDALTSTSAEGEVGSLPLMQLSGTGVWAHQLRYADAGAVAELAAELEELGYDALWIPDVGGDVLGAIETLLGSTSRTTIATGILNIW